LLKGEGDQQKMLRVAFDTVLSYRNTDEGDLLRTIGNGLGENTLFTVEDSQYINWFHKENHGIRKSDNITHYAIYTMHDCLDILSKDLTKC